MITRWLKRFLYSAVSVFVLLNLLFLLLFIHWYVKSLWQEMVVASILLLVSFTLLLRYMKTKAKVEAISVLAIAFPTIRQWALPVAGAVIGIITSALFQLSFYPAMAQLEPAFREAQRMCYQEVQKGMSYQEVEENVGYLFANNNTGIDRGGNGSKDLINNIQSLDASCRIEFRNGRVESSQIGIVWF